MMPVTNNMLEYAQNFVSDARRCMVFPPLCLFRPMAPAYGSGLWFRLMVPAYGSGLWFRLMVPAYGSGLLLQFTSQQGDAGIDKEQ